MILSPSLPRIWRPSLEFFTGGKGARQTDGKAIRQSSGKVSRRTATSDCGCSCCPGLVCDACLPQPVAPDALTVTLTGATNITGCFPCNLGGAMTTLKVLGSWSGGTYCVPQLAPIGGQACQYLYSAPFSALTVSFYRNAGCTSEICHTDTLNVSVGLGSSPFPFTTVSAFLSSSAASGGSSGDCDFSPGAGAFIFYTLGSAGTPCTGSFTDTNGIAMADANGCFTSSLANGLNVAYGGSCAISPCCT